jgi:hypothetical protein
MENQVLFFPLQLLGTWEPARCDDSFRGCEMMMIIIIITTYGYEVWFTEMFSCLLFIHFLICMKQILIFFSPRCERSLQGLVMVDEQKFPN